MKHINFYQKYRPARFQDIVEQHETVTVLKNVVACAKIHHAYLFTGVQGVGKTSTARIFAQAINCTNNQLGDICQKCDFCQQNQQFSQDIIEIDAASHNGVEEIRNLKVNAFMKPAIAKYKVYIVDEVHMLSKNAFNAFLKLLEEPPRHVVFILITTEIIKIPETILSRCQLFYFQPITIKGLTTFLSEIAQKELLNFDSAAIKLIANHVRGLVRDALNLLEQIAFSEIGQKITLNRVCKYLGLLNETLKKTFLQKLLQQEQKEVFQMITSFAKNNVDFQHFNEQLLILTKELIVHQTTKESHSDYRHFPQLSITVLEKIINILLDYHPRFQFRLQSQLLFEIMCTKILTLLKIQSAKVATADSSNLALNDEEHKIDLQTGLDLLKKRKWEDLFPLKSKWLLLDQYFHHSRFGELANLLSRCFLVACTDEALLLRVENKNDRNHINNLVHHTLLEEFSETFLGKVYQFKVMTSDELDVLKLQYQQRREF